MSLTFTPGGRDGDDAPVGHQRAVDLGRVAGVVGVEGHDAAGVRRAARHGAAAVGPRARVGDDTELGDAGVGDPGDEHARAGGVVGVGRAVVGDGHGEQAVRGPPQQGVVVALGRRAGVGHHELGEPLGAARVGDVEQALLEAGLAAGVGGVLADAEHPALADLLEVRRVAGDLQLARHPGRLGVAQVDDEQRVGLAEGHDVGGGPGEADAADLLGRAEAGHLADRREGRRRHGAAR